MPVKVGPDQIPAGDEMFGDRRVAVVAAPAPAGATIVAVVPDETGPADESTAALAAPISRFRRIARNRRPRRGLVAWRVDRKAIAQPVLSTGSGRTAMLPGHLGDELVDETPSFGFLSSHVGGDGPLEV